MTSSAAPFYADLATMTAPSRCEYLVTSDGARIRFAYWNNPQIDSNKLIVIFVGRAEYIEKYQDVIMRFLARGFHVSCHDWRGQGLSSRSSGIKNRNHVDDFSLYQRDAERVLEELSAFQGRRVLFCHSMGGAIGLQYLLREENFNAVIFNSPMWDIALPFGVKHFRRPILWLAKKFNLMHSLAPGLSEGPYEISAPLTNNLLTSDPDQMQLSKERLRRHPELGVGGATFGWISAAFECLDTISGAPSPALPGIVFLGHDENIVSSAAIRTRSSQTKHWQLCEFAGARHEIYLENPSILEKYWEKLDSWLSQQIPSSKKSSQ